MVKRQNEKERNAKYRSSPSTPDPSRQCLLFIMLKKVYYGFVMLEPACSVWLIDATVIFSLLSSWRSSGDITLSFLSGPASPVRREGDFPFWDRESDGVPTPLGMGKLFFLSTAWTTRSKRRKSDSARVRIGISSIEFESSLTIKMLVPFHFMGLSRRTVFQNFVKMLQMVHDDVSVLL